MRLFHYVIADPSLLPPFPVDAWGAPPFIPPNANFPFGTAVASVLYSDVGSNLYRVCGPGIGMGANNKAWLEHGPIGTIWPVDVGEEDLAAEIEWIPEDGMTPIWELDAAAMRSDIHTTSTDTHATTFHFLPNGGVAQFIFERNKHAVPDHLVGKLMWGVKLAADPDALCPPFATWALDPDRSSPSTLMITRLRASHSTLPILLSAAKSAARVLALEQVETWNLDPGLVPLASALGGKTDRREDHLPALAWYREGDVVWEYNEKYCWC
jgi:hypothetical protein